MSARRFGLIANAGKPGAAELTRNLYREFARRGRELVIESRTAELVGVESAVTASDLAERCELIIVLGGDGTLLQVVHDLAHRLPPIFGINLGSLGFLTSVNSGAWLEAVESLEADNYTFSERTLLGIEVLRDGELMMAETALNDAVISRGELSRLIKIDVLIDGISFSEFNADGLIVATPTGSTAYSLSAGGPVLAPDSGVFVITPICPHVLTMRPMIVSDASMIEIAPSREQSDIFLTLDGQNAIHVEPDDRIRVTKAPNRLSLATLPGMGFFEVLRQKLKWSGSAI
jgi:NAD+ kinase